MALTRQTELPINREERTDEVVIEAPLGAGYNVRVLRITRDYYADGRITEVSRRWIVRNMTQLMADSDAFPLLASLPPIFDRWSQEDDAAAGN